MTEQWRCPQHTEVVRTKPGRCGKKIVLLACQACEELEPINTVAGKGNALIHAFCGGRVKREKVVCEEPLELIE